MDIDKYLNDEAFQRRLAEINQLRSVAVISPDQLVAGSIPASQLEGGRIEIPQALEKPVAE